MSLIKSSPFKWDGSHLGRIKNSQITLLDDIKIGRILQIFEITIDGYKIKCLGKTIKSLLPVIFDELKPIFSLSKIGTHTFRWKGKLWIAYKPYLLKNKIYPELTLDNIDQSLQPKIEDQVRLNLAFREIFGITDTHEKSLILRYKNPKNSAEIPTVISFLEPGSVAGDEDVLKTILSQTLIDRWFLMDDPTNNLESAIIRLFCINRESPESSISYYHPLIEEVIVRLDSNLITYLDFFFDRLTPYLPY